MLHQGGGWKWMEWRSRPSANQSDAQTRGRATAERDCSTEPQNHLAGKAEKIVHSVFD